MNARQEEERGTCTAFSGQNGPLPCAPACGESAQSRRKPPGTFFLLRGVLLPPRSSPLHGNAPSSFSFLLRGVARPFIQGRVENLHRSFSSHGKFSVLRRRFSPRRTETCPAAPAAKRPEMQERGEKKGGPWQKAGQAAAESLVTPAFAGIFSARCRAVPTVSWSSSFPCGHGAVPCT